MTESPELLITGATVVTAARSRRADVAVTGGRIAAIEPDLAGLRASARETIDATGLLILPGAVDVHTHIRIATDAAPDRFFQDSVAAAFGGTTTFLSFNTQGRPDRHCPQTHHGDARLVIVLHRNDDVTTAF